MSGEIAGSSEQRENEYPGLYCLGAFQKVNGLYIPVDPELPQSQRELFYMPNDFHPASEEIVMNEKAKIEFSMLGSLEIIIPKNGSARDSVVAALQANPHLIGEKSDGSDRGYAFNLTETPLPEVEGGYKVKVVFFKSDQQQAHGELPLRQRHQGSVSSVEAPRIVDFPL